MTERTTVVAIHRVTGLILWIVLAVLAASVIYTGFIAIANWKHIGV